jgi:CarD family transcriptional regulator
VLKSLYYLNLIKPLSFREKKMMEKAKDLIVSEISEVAELPTDEIEDKLMQSLSVCFQNISARVDS